MSSQFNHSNAAIEHHHQLHDHHHTTGTASNVQPQQSSTSSSIPGSANDDGNRLGSTSSIASFHKPQISNLTKNLLSSSNSQINNNSAFASDTGIGSNQSQLPPNPPSYASSINNNNNNTLSSSSARFIPNNSTDFNCQSYHSFNANNGFQQYSHPSVNDNINYIPSSHNTPTVVSTSYSSNHSYNASLPTINTTTNNNNFQSSSSSYRPPTGIVPHAIPTTNVFTDTAMTNRDSFSSASSSFTQSGFSIPNQYQPPAPHSMQSHSLQRQLRFPNSLPASNNNTNNISSSFHQQHAPPLQEQEAPHLQQSQPQAASYLNIVPQSVIVDRSLPTSGATSAESSTPLNPPPSNLRNQALSLPQDEHHSASSLTDKTPPPPPQPPAQLDPYVPPEPDHYMTYSEFLTNLTTKDHSEGSTSSSSSSEEHLNIVDYPVNDLIVMLSCLLTKIIEANDKLHPNHFENTIAIRQKLKDEKRLKKLQRKKQQQQRQQQQQQEGESDDIDVDHDYRNESSERRRAEEEQEDDDMDFDEDDEGDDEDDDDDEIKNKYLANVLAFHGTNIPGISLHAYLSRVLKYCPVTNEVFLSLLVYFDRIAKKANNLNQQKKKSVDSQNTINNNIDNDQNESEQLFVMDSYNIHRLIISGITVSSKFFSDIFYKNLRYAKVGGLPLEELNYLELQFLLLLDFKLMISVEDLQNYGDLLLRFWKREQITNELVNNNPENPSKQEIKG
ncbi:PCL7 [[Candida] subhashii]|uniref:PCL7 n=1 Tax=[Candida] subhashii TaxID=561895 RepID=A0A8J5UKY8_9ASCO|nr:PCL7 [[Candida] subhashii]KAG7662372.1 PCL7 [[Candida] subhashii]